MRKGCMAISVHFENVQNTSEYLNGRRLYPYWTHWKEKHKFSVFEDNWVVEMCIIQIYGNEPVVLTDALQHPFSCHHVRKSFHGVFFEKRQIQNGSHPVYLFWYQEVSGVDARTFVPLGNP